VQPDHVPLALEEVVNSIVVSVGIGLFVRGGLQFGGEHFTGLFNLDILDIT